MKIKAIGFVAIPVTDVKRARSFYEDVLGPNWSEEMMGGKWIEYAVGADTLAIANVGNSGGHPIKEPAPRSKWKISSRRSND